MANRDDLSRNLKIVGLVGIAGSILWWFVFYSRVISFAGGSSREFGRAFGCLFYSSFECSFVKGVSSLAGLWPFEPFFLWLSGGILLAGLIVGAPPGGGIGAVPGGSPATRPEPANGGYKIPPAEQRWLISAILANGSVLKFELSQAHPVKIVGRDPRQADVVIADDSISRAHARFELQNNGLWVSDLKSTNGTKVDDRSINDEPVRLHPADKLFLGLIALTVSAA